LDHNLSLTLTGALPQNLVNSFLPNAFVDISFLPSVELEMQKGHNHHSWNIVKLGGFYPSRSVF